MHGIYGLLLEDRVWLPKNVTVTFNKTESSRHSVYHFTSQRHFQLEQVYFVLPHLPHWFLSNQKLPEHPMLVIKLFHMLGSLLQINARNVPAKRPHCFDVVGFLWLCYRFWFIRRNIYIYDIYSQPIHIIWYKWYWHNSCSEQYNSSNKTHINPARSQTYQNPKYISFNMWLWIQVPVRYPQVQECQFAPGHPWHAPTHGYDQELQRQKEPLWWQESKSQGCCLQT